MKPGIYRDAAATKAAEDAYWAEHGYTFGAWQFLPETGEIRRNGCFLHRLSPANAYNLNRLCEAYPAYIPGDPSGSLKVTVKRLRAIVGQDAILAVHSWGYRFNPEAVL